MRAAFALKSPPRRSVVGEVFENCELTGCRVRSDGTEPMLKLVRIILRPYSFKSTRDTSFGLNIERPESTRFIEGF